MNANQLFNNGDSEGSVSQNRSPPVKAGGFENEIDESGKHVLIKLDGGINNTRDTIREIYRTLCADYGIRYNNSLLNQKDNLPVKDEVFKKELLDLIEGEASWMATARKAISSQY